jgi:uncharacterized protein
LGGGHKLREMPEFARPRQVSFTKLSRGAYAALGLGFVGLGILGALLPLLPSTIFFILALWCFQRSSSRLENWLLGHRVVGPALRNWRESGSMSLSAKRWAIGGIWVSMVVSAWLVGNLWVALLLLATAICLTWYLATRPTARPLLRTSCA